MVAEMKKSGLRSQLLLLVMVVASVLSSFLFWYDAWFGRVLSEEELGKYLANEEKPRQVQHALVQIAERIRRADPEVCPWYQKVVELSDHPFYEIRSMAAWVMGQDSSVEAFRRVLLRLENDVEPVVRRNAVLALVNFGETSDRSELMAMLKVYSVTAPQEGFVSFLVELGDWVEPGTHLIRLSGSNEEVSDVRARLSGRVTRLQVPEGDQVRKDQKLISLSPDPEHVLEALRALYWVGEEEDLELIESYTRNPAFDQRIRDQSQLTVEAICRGSRGGPGQSVKKPEKHTTRNLKPLN